MDVLEEYLKIEKLDPTQVPDSAIKHKEESFAKMSSEFSDVESSGKKFIKDANEVNDIVVYNGKFLVLITVVVSLICFLSHRVISTYQVATVYDECH
jgi:hypothetical protein